MREQRSSARVQQPPPRIMRLPDIGENQAPGWRIVRHSVGAIVSVFIATLLVSLIVAVFVGMRVTIDGDGVVEPARVWPLRSLESGTLAEVLVRTGDTVRAGQIVARLDTLASSGVWREARAQLMAARTEALRLEASAPIDSARLHAAIAQQDAHVTTARTAMRDRMTAFLVKGDLDSIVRASDSRTHIGLDAPAADYLAAQAGAQIARIELRSLDLGTFKVDQQRAEIQRLQSEVAIARARLSRQTIHAPATGVVLTDEVEQLLGSAVSPGQSVLEIGDTRHWRVVLRVSERDVHRIRVGDRATIQLPALSMLADDQVPGTVSFVGWQSSVAPPGNQTAVGLGGFRVIVEIDSAAIAALPANTLRRGYAAHGKIVTRSARAIQILFENLRDRARGLSRD